MASLKSFTGTFAVSSFSDSTQIGSTSSKTATVQTTAANSAPTISGFTEAIGAFMFEVQELDALTEFDEKLWLTIIDTITVHADGRMTFKFQGGTEIEA